MQADPGELSGLGPSMQGQFGTQPGMQANVFGVYGAGAGAEVGAVGPVGALSPRFSPDRSSYLEIEGSSPLELRRGRSAPAGIPRTPRGIELDPVAV